jgi:DNA-binding response OmpR family regulator
MPGKGDGMTGKKVLIVDDEKDCCEFLREYLAVRGCDVDVAYNGLKAKHFVDAGVEYDCVFFDCNMPGLSGVEFCSILKERGDRAKKVMISGYDLINEDFTRSLGVDVFLRKPFSLESVKEAMENV